MLKTICTVIFYTLSFRGSKHITIRYKWVTRINRRSKGTYLLERVETTSMNISLNPLLFPNLDRNVHFFLIGENFRPIIKEVFICSSLFPTDVILVISTDVNSSYSSQILGWRSLMSINFSSLLKARISVCKTLYWGNWETWGNKKQRTLQLKIFTHYINTTKREGGRDVHGLSK